MNQIKRNIYFYIGLLLFVIFLVADRYYFAQVTQWREDQATNIWLGFQIFNKYPIVGLMSSQYIVNPNGMALIGTIFSLFPNLLWTSTALGVLQVASLIFFSYVVLKKEKNLFILFSLVCLSSAVLRGTGGELWNNWIYVTFILFAVSFSLLRKYFFALLFIFILPSLYLAGPLYVLACGLIYFLSSLDENYSLSEINFKYFFVSLVLVLIFIAITTWIPFFSVVSLHELSQVSHAPISKRVWTAFLQVFFYFKLYFTLPRINQVMFISDLESHTVVSVLYYAIRTVLVAQFFVMLVSLYRYYIVFKNNFLASLKNKLIRISLLVSIFPLICAVFSPLLGGPTYIYPATRLDQVVVFLPFYYYSLFVLPLILLDKAGFSLKLIKITYATAIVFVFLNIFHGWSYVYYAKEHKGDIPKFDVPLTDKRAVVDFIANDWKKQSQSLIIPVDYNIQGPWWQVESFGEKLEKYYKAPMIIGRSYDYEFLRVYGLSNYQEGIQHRKVGTGRYIISYTNDHTKKFSSEVYYFGRLKVNIIQN